MTVQSYDDDKFKRDHAENMKAPEYAEGYHSANELLRGRFRCAHFRLEVGAPLLWVDCSYGCSA